jgi:hypothetical protein
MLVFLLQHTCTPLHARNLLQHFHGTLAALTGISELSHHFSQRKSIVAFFDTQAHVVIRSEVLKLLIKC